MPRFAPLAAVLCAGCVTASGLGTADNHLTVPERFEQIAFYDEGEAEAHPLRKWRGPMRYAGLGDLDVFSQYQLDIAVQMAELTDLSGIQTEHDDENPNVWIFFGDRDETLDQIKELKSKTGISPQAPITCTGFTLTDPRTLEIFAAGVFIRTELASTDVRSCIAQELTQIMGLPNDIQATDTAFSSDSLLERLSDTDRQLVRILYDDRLRPGMTLEQAMPIVREIASGA